MAKNSLVVVGCISAMFMLAFPCRAADATKTLKEALNSRSYILLDPAESWPYAGGLLVIKPNAKTATFIDIPQAAKPSATSETNAFLAQSKSAKFTLNAVLTGLASLITGNPGAGFGHSSSTKVDQISGTVSKITFGDAQKVIKSHDDIATTVRSWMNSGYQVMVVGLTVSTEKISVATNSTTNLDLAFNGSVVSKCSDASGDSTKSNSAGSTNSSGGGTSGSSNAGAGAGATTPTSASSGQNPPSSTGANSSQQGSSAGSPQSSAPKTSSSSSGPGGELHMCISGSSSVSLNSDKPLIFAVAAYRAEFVKDASGTIEKDASGLDNIDLQPAFSISPGGQAENSDAEKKCVAGQDPGECSVSVKVAAGVPTKWTSKHWGERIE
jgi:hypothetical protein